MCILLKSIPFIFGDLFVTFLSYPTKKPYTGPIRRNIFNLYLGFSPSIEDTVRYAFSIPSFINMNVQRNGALPITRSANTAHALTLTIQLIWLDPTALR